MTTVSIIFKLASFQPGSRGYNNAIFEPVSEFHINVDVPVTANYLKNAELILTEPIKGNPSPLPILTIEGWAYIEDQFLARDTKTKVEQVSADEIKWEDEEA